MTTASSLDETIRPTKWDDYIGQDRMKARLETTIEAAVTQKRLLDPILLTAPPGTGKTTIAALIADRSLLDFMSITLPIKPDRFFDIVEEFEGVLLLDELHAAPNSFQELLQPALEDKVLRTPDNYEIDVSEIVFMGATITEYKSKILQPLQDRFEIQPTWITYTNAEIALIISGMAQRLGFSLTTEVCEGLAGACGATPRLAKRFVKAARDLDAVGQAVSSQSVLSHVGVDADGLGQEHIDYLQTIRSQGGKTGLRTLSNLLCIKPGAVEDLERVLAQKGLVHLGSTGRRLTNEGRAKLGKKPGKYAA